MSIPTVNGAPINIAWIEWNPHHTFTMIKILCREYIARIVALEAENKRLREHLDEIANVASTNDDALGVCKYIAHTALTEGSGK